VSRDVRTLTAALGYEFDDPELLRAALTHRSALGQNNERLEFLGDAALGFVIASWLYREVPDASEGDLSRLRSSLVNKSTLAGIAADLSLGDYLALGGGELKSGGFRRASIIADALEALLGALYLDGGLARVEGVIERLFAQRVRDVLEVGVQKDSKTLLQEYLQAQGAPLPDYTVSEVRGLAHEHVFTVECTAGEPVVIVRGEGSSRRGAEQAAASRMLEQLRDG